MKRFWKTAAAVPAECGWRIELDGKPLRTPARTILRVLAASLATAVAAEWNEAGETIDPRAMPLTGLANAAIDRIAPDRRAFAAGLAHYGETDLACYRGESPAELVRRQAAEWDPLLAWARRRYDVDFVVTAGVLPVAQPQPTIERLRHAVAALNAFQLAGLSPLVTIGGSLVGALAVLEHGIAADDAWLALSVDERWQLERWGSDAEAEQRLENRRREFMAGARFLGLLE